MKYEILSQPNINRSFEDGDLDKDPNNPANIWTLQENMEALNRHNGPRVGDFLIRPDGKPDRFTHLWDDHIQTGGIGGSFYIGQGYISYSGGLEPGVKLADLHRVDGESKMGSVWFFHKGHMRAHNSVSYLVPFRVFVLKPGADISGLW